MIKVIHIITGLNMGGAEKMLYNIVTGSDKNRYEHTVLSMMDMGYYGPKLQEQGVKVFCLNMGRGKPELKSIFKGRKICKDADIIQTWMYHANIFGAILKLLLPGKRLIWGIRLSDINKNRDTKSTIRASYINSKLSWLPQAIVSNSCDGIVNHVSYGYKKEKMRYIPNGIDTELFYKRDINTGCEETPDGYLTLCTVGRWHAQKGYRYLIEALSEVRKVRNDFIQVMCGNQLSEDNRSLVNEIRGKGLSENILLLGPSSEVFNILSRADVFILPSIGEGFPNVLGEAMACELPGIVTDVGDSAMVLGDCGWVIPPGDSNAIASAIMKVLETDREMLREMGTAARRRIIEQYGIEKSVELFENLYIEVINKKIN